MTVGRKGSRKAGRVLLAQATIIGGVIGGSLGLVVQVLGGEDRPAVVEPESQAADEPRGGVDYNCALPGKGFPWLDYQGPLSEENPETGEKFTGFFGYFTTKAGNPNLEVNPLELHLPVRLYDGQPNMDEVYTLLCSVHPDLGGTGLDKLTGDEVGEIIHMDQVPAYLWEEYDNYYSDYTAWVPGEARIHDEVLRIYYLPPISEDLADALTNRDEEGETERFRVVLTGTEHWAQLGPATEQSPGSVRVRINYDIEFELSVGWRIDDIVWADAVVKSSSYHITARQSASGSVARHSCTNCVELLTRPRPRVTWRPGSQDFVFFDFSDLVPTVDVFLDGGGAHYGIPLAHFFDQAETEGIPLTDSHGATVEWSPDLGEIFTTTGELRYDVTVLDE